MFYASMDNFLDPPGTAVAAMTLNGTDEQQQPGNGSVNPIPDSIWVTRVGVFGIGGTTIAICGILCNSISIVVLANFRSKSSAPFLLICLEVVDCMLLFWEMALETLPTLCQARLLSDSYRDFIRPIYVVMYPVAHIAQTATTGMTVLITLERYVAVAKPLLAATVCSMTWARRAVLAILVWAVVFHVPLYLAYDYRYAFNNATNTSRVVFYRTEIGESEFYNDWFVVWINLTFEFLIPFILLLIFNVLTIRALRASKLTTSASASAISSVAASSNSKRSAREGRLTGMVVAVTIIFFVCELFPAIALIVVRGKDAFVECSAACANFVSVADTMVLLNSGVNFVAYCAIGKQFRDIFARIFLRRCRPLRRWCLTCGQGRQAGAKLTFQAGHHHNHHHQSSSSATNVLTGTTSISSGNGSGNSQHQHRPFVLRSPFHHASENGHGEGGVVGGGCGGERGVGGSGRGEGEGLVTVKSSSPPPAHHILHLPNHHKEHFNECDLDRRRGSPLPTRL